MNKRTTFITAGAVTGVLLAGTAAVGANIGILNAADNGNVGELNAAVDVTIPADTVPTSVEPQVIDVYVEDPAPSTPATTASPITPTTTAGSPTQEFAVDDAGIVTVESTGTGVLLDGVAVADGWAWTASQTEQGLEVTFTSAAAEYVFYAGLGDDGTIVARVDEPIVNVVQVPAASSSPSNTTPSNTTPSSYDDHDDDDHDDDDDDDHDDDDHDDDDHDDDDHEGGDDDD